MGPNQEGLILDALKCCYLRRGLSQDLPQNWHFTPPTFLDLKQELETRATTQDCKDSARILLKLAATFTYGIFNRPAFPLDQPGLSRVDLCKLPPELAAIAAETVAGQLMNNHRLLGEVEGNRTYLFVDEAKELSRSPALDRIIADGRKYGLALVLASQSERHLSPDVIANSATKIVLPVDQTEVKKVATKFRFSESHVAALTPLNALCRFGTQAEAVQIWPYYQRIQETSHVETRQPPLASRQTSTS